MLLQLPLMQSVSPTQAEPSGMAAQRPPMQLLLAHSAFEVQLVPASLAHLSKLHSKDTHDRPMFAHVPSCNPSFGMLAPLGSRVTHVLLAPSQ